jgi:hypothetical protein
VPLPDPFPHHPTCSADYPEKAQTGESPRHLQRIPLDDGEVAHVCVDCGTCVILDADGLVVNSTG